jgi:hypothetical protein
MNSSRRPSRYCVVMYAVYLTAGIFSLPSYGEAPPDAAQSRVAMVMLYAEMCKAAIPGFEQRASSLYGRWRAKNAADIRAVEKDHPEFMATLNQTNHQDVAHPRPDGIDHKQCDDLLAGMDAEIDLAARPGDMTTPEGTWASYVESLRAGDLDGVRRCMAGDYFRRVQPVLLKMTPEGMRKLAESYQSLTALEDLGTVRAYTLITKDRIGYQVNFELVGRIWVIVSM